MKGEEDKNTRRCMCAPKDDTDKKAISMEHNKTMGFWNTSDTSFLDYDFLKIVEPGFLPQDQGQS